MPFDRPTLPVDEHHIVISAETFDIEAAPFVFDRPTVRIDTHTMFFDVLTFAIEAATFVIETVAILFDRPTICFEAYENVFVKGEMDVEGLLISKVKLLLGYDSFCKADAELQTQHNDSTFLFY